MKKELEIKESLSGSFFVKLGNDNLGGFHKREHAELFLKAYTGDFEREISKRAWQDGVNYITNLISINGLEYAKHVTNPYGKM